MSTTTTTDFAPITGFDDIDEMIDGLIELADWRRNQPDIAGGMAGTAFCVYDHRTDLSHAEIVRAIASGAPIGSVEKSLGGDNDTIMFIRREFKGGVKVSHHTARENVCVRKVVGTETVEIPDPEAPTVTIEREIVEWDCQPLLEATG